MDRPVKDNAPIPTKPFDSEEGWSRAATRTLEEQRRESGGLSDDPGDAPVRDTRPFRNLRG